MPFYENGRAAGTFDTGVEQLVTAVLASPDFLYRAIAPTPGDAAETFALDDFELASRLSFFIWSQGPDDELLEARGRRQARRRGRRRSAGRAHARGSAGAVRS